MTFSLAVVYSPSCACILTTEAPSFFQMYDHCFEAYYDSGCERDQLHWYSIQDLICKFYDALKPNYQKLTSNYMQFY
jgi:hypothetical protein